MAKYACPQCHGRSFTVVIRQLADVDFDADGEHEVLDGPYGDLEWDDDSIVNCRNDGCGWSGTLKETEHGKNQNV